MCNWYYEWASFHIFTCIIFVQIQPLPECTPSFFPGGDVDKQLFTPGKTSKKWFWYGKLSSLGGSRTATSPESPHQHGRGLLKAASLDLSVQPVGSSTVESRPQQMLTAFITSGAGISYESCSFLSFRSLIIFWASRVSWASFRPLGGNVSSPKK